MFLREDRAARGDPPDGGSDSCMMLAAAA